MDSFIIGLCKTWLSNVLETPPGFLQEYFDIESKICIQLLEDVLTDISVGFPNDPRFITGDFNARIGNLNIFQKVNTFAGAILRSRVHLIWVDLNAFLLVHDFVIEDDRMIYFRQTTFHVPY